MLILGDQKMSFEQVIDSCTNVPARSDIVKTDTATNVRWKPISHGSFVEAMAGGIEHHGLRITSSAFALNRTGHLLVGGFNVEGPMLPQLPNNISAHYNLLVRHANDMSHGVQINAGLELMVCTNGCIGGEAIARHKHTNGFDVSEWARDIALVEFMADCRNQVSSLQSLRDIDCTDDQAAKCILEAGSRGILPLARTVDVWEEWKNPVFSTEDFPLNTAYKLMGDLTHVAQKCSPHRQMTIMENSMPLVREFTVQGISA